MKKKLLKHTLFIAVLSTLSIIACSRKTAKESSTVSPTEAAKESSSKDLSDAKKESSNTDSEEAEKENSAPNPTESGATTESEKEKAENNSGSLVGAYNTNKLFYKG